MISNSSDSKLETGWSEERHLSVSIQSQLVELKQGSNCIWTAPVSTAKNGVGEEEGSHQTPRGWFRIAEKIGDQLPLGSILKSRKPTGFIWSADLPKSEEDLILTRILWLEGVEPHNANTKNRYIYFHGTNQESLIGQPASHGCIRLRNQAMLQLFDFVEIQTPVWIGL